MGRKKKSKVKSYWVKTMYACARMDVDENGIIVMTAPIWAKWKGQPFETFTMGHRYQFCKWVELEDKN